MDFAHLRPRGVVACAGAAIVAIYNDTPPCLFRVLFYMRAMRVSFSSANLLAIQHISMSARAFQCIAPPNACT